MKFLSEYRDSETARKMLAAIKQIVTRPWVIMEVCGGQTHAIVRSGIDQLLPEEIRLVHGPGCPVCVTSQGYIDAACELALRHAARRDFQQLRRYAAGAGQSQ